MTIVIFKTSHLNVQLSSEWKNTFIWTNMFCSNTSIIFIAEMVKSFKDFSFDKQLVGSLIINLKY
jgi:hypothetical protein